MSVSEEMRQTLSLVRSYIQEMERLDQYYTEELPMRQLNSLITKADEFERLEASNETSLEIIRQHEITIDMWKADCERLEKRVIALQESEWYWQGRCRELTTPSDVMVERVAKAEFAYNHPNSDWGPDCLCKSTYMERARVCIAAMRESGEGA